MPRSSRSGTFAMVHAAVIDDRRVGAAELRMLVALGTYADAEGWCWPKQKQLADRLGITRQAVSKALRDLSEHGYIEIHLQHDEATGSQIASRYRVRLDFVLPEECRRTPQPDIAGGQRQIAPPRNVSFTPPATPEVAPPATPEVAAIEEQTNTTDQRNRPKGLQRSDERPPSAGSRVIDLIVAAGLPKPSFGPRDGKALKDTGADPALVAEAYGALFRGAWGDDFMRRNLSVRFVVERLDAYQAWKLNPKNGAHRNGTAQPPAQRESMSSKWAGFEGRGGSNLKPRREAPDGR